MHATEFIRRRQKDWAELEKLLAVSATRRRGALSRPQEVSRFASLFRSVCADLARARSLGYPDQLVEYLNSLAARSHNVFYLAPPFPLRRIAQFFTEVFPFTVRKNLTYVAAGLLLFFGPMLTTLSLAVMDSPSLYQLVPKSTLQAMEKMHSKGHSEGRGESEDVAMTGFYVRNNIGIAFQCFASGIFLGLGSIVVLLFNGVIIGATVGYVSQTPSAVNLLSFMVAHGPFELTAIALSGAAGLRLGFGAVITGNRSRAHSLRLAGQDAVRLVLGAAALLAVAALIEGFFSPSSLPVAVKLSVSGISVAFLIWYLAFYGRRRWPPSSLEVRP